MRRRQRKSWKYKHNFESEWRSIEVAWQDLFYLGKYPERPLLLKSIWASKHSRIFRVGDFSWPFMTRSDRHCCCTAAWWFYFLGTGAFPGLASSLDSHSVFTATVIAVAPQGFISFLYIAINPTSCLSAALVTSGSSEWCMMDPVHWGSC